MVLRGGVTKGLLLHCSNIRCSLLLLLLLLLLLQSRMQAWRCIGGPSWGAPFICQLIRRAPTSVRETLTSRDGCCCCCCCCCWFCVGVAPLSHSLSSPATAAPGCLVVVVVAAAAASPAVALRSCCTSDICTPHRVLGGPFSLPEGPLGAP